MRTILAVLPILALAACGAGDNDPGPGSVTQSEARELNEAAEMLDVNAVSADALNDTGNTQ
ncbi:hypothetical protein [uncultured Sphingomonas sp.]|uniref:hypothetical protein n=1 Tax=uncultured Sphingomonas sp. TaxID=158754 RepID=UPI0025E7739C|nr:hypothetical protein [uncultured Sphingomonas sp.]